MSNQDDDVLAFSLQQSGWVSPMANSNGSETSTESPPSDSTVESQQPREGLSAFSFQENVLSNSGKAVGFISVSMNNVADYANAAAHAMLTVLFFCVAAWIRIFPVILNGFIQALPSTWSWILPFARCCQCTGSKGCHGMTRVYEYLWESMLKNDLEYEVGSEPMFRNWCSWWPSLYMEGLFDGFFSHVGQRDGPQLGKDMGGSPIPWARVAFLVVTAFLGYWIGAKL